MASDIKQGANASIGAVFREAGAAGAPLPPQRDSRAPNPGEDTDRGIANGWDITDPKVLEAWRAQEPFNAHSHLLSMMLGNSETIPVADGNLVIGQWQNVLFLDLDGDRERTVGIQIVGVQ